MKKTLLLSLSFYFFICISYAQITKAPEVKDGDGPYTQLIIRGVTLINGTGAPPLGPMDIVIENNRIVQIQGVGSPGLPINQNRRPVLKAGGKELNCEGMYALPGLSIPEIALHISN